MNILLTELPKFPAGGVPVAVAANVVGKAPEWVKEGIVQGYFPVGTYSEAENRRNFYISPMKLYEYTGYYWEGKEDAESRETN